MQKLLAGSQSEFSNLRGGMLLMLAFYEMMMSSSLKSKIGKP
jgi:hypothetical protein